MAKNIEINYKNEGGYEVLYPNVQVSNVIGLEENYYNKTEVENVGLKKNLLCNQAVFSINGDGRIQLINNIKLRGIIGLYGHFTVSGIIRGDCGAYLEGSSSTNMERAWVLYNDRTKRFSNEQFYFILWFSNTIYYAPNDVIYSYDIVTTSSLTLNDKSVIGGMHFKSLENTSISLYIKAESQVNGNITLYSLSFSSEM